MVELVAVIIILGVIGAVSAPRFFERTVFDSREFHDAVIATLRYAQKEAIAKRRFVCVSFPANNSVALTYGADNSCVSGALPSPSGSPYPLASNHSSFAPVPAGFSFDCLGRPRNIGAPPAVASCSDTNAVLTVNLAVQVQNAPVIVVERETGYVH